MYVLYSCMYCMHPLTHPNVYLNNLMYILYIIIYNVYIIIIYNYNYYVCTHMTMICYNGHRKVRESHVMRLSILGNWSNVTSVTSLLLSLSLSLFPLSLPRSGILRVSILHLFSKKKYLLLIKHQLNSSSQNMKRYQKLQVFVYNVLY